MFVTFVDECSIVFFVFHLRLIYLLGVLLVFLGCFFFEVSPLVEHFVELGLEAISFDFLFILLVKCVGKLDFEFGDLVVSGVQDGSLLLAQGLDETVMALFAVLGFLGQGVLQALDLAEVLSFFKLDSVSFKVGVFDTFFGVRS